MENRPSESSPPPASALPTEPGDFSDAGSGSSLPGQDEVARSLSSTSVDQSCILEESGPIADGTSLEDPDTLTLDPPQNKVKITMLGDFLLVRKLGEGGMGTVYEAQQVGLDRVVALKVLTPYLASDRKFIKRFQREARVMAHLDHPHILRCFTVGESHGYHYLAMELASRGSLESWIQNKGRLTVGDSLHVILAAASGLQHAHEHHLIHREIKPGNILITGKGVVKVSDLGLAKALTEEDLTLTRTGMGVGTPLYMPLEQMRDAKHADVRSDIYALGCMLYRCLTGRPPFQAESYIDLYQAKEKGLYPPARSFNENVPKRLDLIIDRALDKNPKHRYQSCAELIQDLQSLGLANPALSLVSDAAASGAVLISRAPPSPRPKPATSTPLPQARRAPSQDWWYLRALNFDGTRQMTTKQILELIQRPNFDLKAEASRSPDTGFQSLLSYREFEPTVRARASKKILDMKATRTKNQMASLLKEEAEYQEEKQTTANIRAFSAWVAPLIGLAVLSGLGFLIWWASKILFK